MDAPLHRRRLGLLLALLVLLVVLLAGSGVAVAQWMARATNPANTFSAGHMEIEDSLAGSAILGASGLAPGSLVTGTVTITNGSTMPVSLTLSASGSGSAHATPNLTGVLHLAVRACGPDCTTGATSYAGPLDGLGNNPMPGNGAAGAWTPHEVHRYLFTVTLPVTASAALMGQSTSVDFTWTATPGE